MSERGESNPRGPLATLWSRRDLLTRSAWGMVAASIGVAAFGSLRLLFPRVSFAPPSTVVLGSPDDFAVGQVSSKWKESHQLIVVRTDEGFYALKSVCSHLGCIPAWKPVRRMFKCPCHGSGFELSGVNVEGPAPRPLERYKIYLDEAGRLTVDASYTFRKERGEWDREGAFLPYRGGSNDVAT